MSELIMKISTVILVLIIAVSMVLVPRYEAKEQQLYIDAHYEFEKRAAGYKAEQSELRQKLAELKKDIEYYGDKTNIVVGFAVTGANDIAYVREKAEFYKFTPVIVLDCTMDFADMSAIIEKTDAAWEIMMYVPDFSGYVGLKLQEAKANIEGRGRKVSDSVFARVTSISTQGRVILEESGFGGCTVYHDSPISGQSESGIVYFDFARIASGNLTIENRLSICYENNASMIYVFDMQSIYDGYVPETKMAHFLGTLTTYAQKENATFATIAEVESELAKINAIKEETEASRALEIDAAEMRIKELYKIIIQIHNECFADVF